MPTNAQAQIPGGPYGYDEASATLRQGQVPGGPFVNQTLLDAGGTAPGEDDGDSFQIRWNL
jgi:hypothetical protein